MPRKRECEKEGEDQLSAFAELIEKLNAVKETYPELALKEGESASTYIDRIRPFFLEMMTLKAFFGDAKATSFMAGLEERKVEHQLMIAEIGRNARTGENTAKLIGTSSGMKALMNGNFRMGA